MSEVKPTLLRFDHFMATFKPQDDYETQILELVQEDLLSQQPAKYLIAKHRNKNYSLPYLPQPQTIEALLELPENSSNITIKGTMADLRPVKLFNRKDGSGTWCRQQFRLDVGTDLIRIVAWGKTEMDSIFRDIEDASNHRGTIEIKAGIYNINEFRGTVYNELHLNAYYYPSIDPVYD